MDESSATVFDVTAWGPALEKFGVVAHLSVALYDGEARVVYGPLPVTCLHAMLEKGDDPSGAFVQCARECLAQSVQDRPPVVVTRACLGVVGVSLVLNGAIIGAVVAGYAMTSFCESLAVSRLARESGTAFQELWSVARKEQPVSLERLVSHGELLQILGDTLLLENDLRRRSEETARQLAHFASHDPLTDLPNRTMLAEYLTRALSSARRHQGRLAVLCLDLDRFKHVNDSFGHPAGDELLRAVGRDLTACVRTSDIVARQGGDEFVIALSDLAYPEDAGRVAQKIIGCVDTPHSLAGRDVRVTATIGISLFPEDGEDAETLLTHADMALYDAKEKGRNRCQFFAAELNVRAAERHAIEVGMMRALDRQEFVLFYQPKVNLKTGAIVGAEALIRWQHPERGLVAPGQFVEIAEECGLIEPIGRWVLREACRQTHAWQTAGLIPIVMSVNVSALEFRDKGFPGNVIDVLRRTGLSPDSLEIEITEGTLMAHVDGTNTILQGLKALGVQVAVDDFGTGWSSLSYLSHFAVDTLKIDRSFVQEITSHAAAAPIVSAVISLGKSLGLRVVAEGVETTEQLAFLRAENCAEAQGYYFSRPLPPPQFTRLLELAGAGVAVSWPHHQA